MNTLTKKYFNRLKSNRTKVRYYQLVRNNFMRAKIEKEELVDKKSLLAVSWRYFDMVIGSAVRREI